MYKRIKQSIERGRAGASVETFLKLPRRAQELIMAISENAETSFWIDVAGPLNEDILKLTPIEIIFKIAFGFYSFLKDISISKGKHWDSELEVPPEVMIGNAGLLEQEKIIINNKKYIVDFLFDGSRGDFLDTIGNTKIVIECDGHNFHQKTKKQVEYDNERQLVLQTAGYEVIRFSGSQIYKDPLECAEKAYNFILSKITK